MTKDNMNLLASDEEQEAIDGGQLEDATENEGHTSCEFEGGAALVVTQILSVQIKEAENGQRHNLFQTRAKVVEKVCKVIIDGGSCRNLASKEIVDKLVLKLLKHSCLQFQGQTLNHNINQLKCKCSVVMIQPLLKELGIVQQRVPCLWSNNMGAKVSC